MDEVKKGQAERNAKLASPPKKTEPPEEKTDEIPTMEDIRKVQDVKDRAKLYAKRRRMIKAQRQRDYKQNVAIPKAMAKSQARKHRLRVYGSAWERARRAEAVSIAGQRASTEWNMRYYRKGKYWYDRRTGRRVR